jgi:hypothetical protein
MVLATALACWWGEQRNDDIDIELPAIGSFSYGL